MTSRLFLFLNFLNKPFTHIKSGGYFSNWCITLLINFNYFLTQLDRIMKSVVDTEAVGGVGLQFTSESSAAVKPFARHSSNWGCLGKKPASCWTKRILTNAPSSSKPSRGYFAKHSNRDTCSFTSTRLIFISILMKDTVGQLKESVFGLVPVHSDAPKCPSMGSTSTTWLKWEFFPMRKLTVSTPLMYSNNSELSFLTKKLGASLALPGRL